MKAARKASLPILLTALALSACTLADEYSGDEPEGRQVNYVASQSGSYTHATSAGDVLTTPDGMTVYIYDKEAKGSASCYGECAEDWPPVLAPAEPAIRRPQSRQAHRWNAAMGLSRQTAASLSRGSSTGRCEGRQP